MAKVNAVWGIDIGQCAIKAICCRPHEKDPSRIVAEDFDYIEYPKILNQPEANREELIREALATFVSRHDLKGHRVAISVPGQAGLSRFIDLPPVEAKKIPDIVKYEARTQIPFALEDVVWDYQALAGGNEDDGYALEAKVGIFAMKRDQLSRILEPLTEAGVEVDTIQLVPLSLYNYVCFDQLTDFNAAGSYDPENPAESTVLFSIGTDTTDIVITNGYRVWQRNIPIGGNHFTQALTKELQLTFTKAEKIKRNVSAAKDPKAVFQAMRPVFSRLVSEIQRSIGYFRTTDKFAVLGKYMMVGNATKLPGLQRYLSQNLEEKVEVVDEFAALIGGTVTSSPQFAENYRSYAVAYGLCIQGLEKGEMYTNLLPKEIITERLIRAKKPWVAAGVAALLVGMTINYSMLCAAWTTSDIKEAGMATAISNSQRVSSESNGYQSTFDGLKASFSSLKETQDRLLSNVDGRILWLELMKAIDSAIPKDSTPNAKRGFSAEDVMKRREIHIESMEVQFFESVEEPWYASVSSLYEDSANAIKSAEAEKAANAPKPDPNSETAVTEAETTEKPKEEPVVEEEPEASTDSMDGMDGMDGMDDSSGGEEVSDEASENPDIPSGEGWVVEIRGHHFHNIRGSGDEGKAFLRNTILKNLREGTVLLPDGENGELIEVPLKDLGICCPVVITSNPIVEQKYDPNALTESNGIGGGGMMDMRGGSLRGGMGLPGGGEDEEGEEKVIWKLRRYDFKIQFCWQPRKRTVRLTGESEEESSEESDEDSF